MRRRRHQNSLAKLPRKSKNRTFHMASGAFIQQAVISPPWRNVNLAFADHIVKPVRIDSGCIYHKPGKEASLICNKLISLMKPSDLLHFCIEPEFYTVGIRILRQSNIQFKRTDDPSRRRVQSGIYILRRIRLLL